MRKTIVTALVVLLVMLAIVSCDSFSALPGAEKPEYTVDGERLVTVRVNISGTSGGRSLTGPLAKQEANYMEVIFRRGTKYYRAVGSVNDSLPIRIPAGEYSPTDAIMLIGRLSDHRLLATGALSATKDVQSTNTTTSTITFSVVSLTANISTTGTAFKIKEDSGNPKINIQTGFTTTDITKQGLIDDLPCFQVPTEIEDIEASLAITGFASTGTIITVTGAPIITFAPTEATGMDALSATFFDSDGDPATFPAAIGTDGTIRFKFTTGDDGGQYKVTFNIPVVGFSGTAVIPGRITWEIHGGTNTGIDYIGTEGGSGFKLLVAASPAEKFVDGTVSKPTTDWP
jgi:hypothetical protein